MPMRAQAHRSARVNENVPASQHKRRARLHKYPTGRQHRLGTPSPQAFIRDQQHQAVWSIWQLVFRVYHRGMECAQYACG